MSEALTEFKKINGCFPHNVVIYRDGVGDSQLEAVLLYEIPQVQIAIREATAGKEIKLMVVRVNKRIN